MLPPSWKGEVQKAVEEATAAEGNQRKAEQDEAGANIAAAINSLKDAQTAQTNSEDSNEKKNQGINKATLVLVAFTVLFTGLSWYVFKRQLTVTQADQRPWIGAPEVNHELVGPDITFILVFKNVGRTPTYGLDIDAKIIKDANWQPGVDSICNERRRNAQADLVKFRKFSAVPQSNFRIGKPDNIDFSTARNYPSAHIVGCAIYGWREDDILHKTGFVGPIFKGDRVSATDIYAIDPD
jgi:hypothetical protein